MKLFALPALAAAACLFAAPAFAEVKPDKRAEARLKMARTVVGMVTTKARYDELIVQVGDQMTAAMRQQGAPLPADFTAKMKLVMNEAIPYAEMVDWSAQLYADRFTLKELTKLRDFYRTPLGKKLAAVLPELGGETGKKMGEILPRRMPALMKKHGLVP